MISYEGTLYRPPSEAASLILQATLGCSYNRCTFCGMYRDKRFRVRPLEELREEIRRARDHAGPVRKVFLADGDALVAKASFLEALLLELREAFPGLRRVSVYASPQSIQVRSVEEMSPSSRSRPERASTTTRPAPANNRRYSAMTLSPRSRVESSPPSSSGWA